ncbi:MAG: peptidase S41 [Rhodocyclales bacterium GWA2_65_20]|nr:MAG: peptidase S41 [Rhodocyclales bacterium GWA2_65_20]
MRSKLQQAGLILIGLVAGILVSLNFSASAQKDMQTPLPIEELRSFADVFNAIKQGYVEPIDDKKLITHAISGMLSNLDPHSAYLDSDAFKDLQVSTQGEFGGLGIEVGMEDGFVKVVSPIEDTPADRAGIKAGDLIIKLDETPVKGMTLNDAVKRMRGKPKTPLKLTIVRKGELKPLEITIIRDKIKVQSVKSKMIEPGYAYLRVTQFQEETVADVARHLDKLFRPAPEAKDKGKGKDKAEAWPEEIKGLVLDLRNDPGGLLHSAIGVSAAFLPPKTLVVSTDGRTEDAKRKYVASTEDYQRGLKDDLLRNLPPAVKTVPLVVLVNGGSASASEIVAGALQDHKRAVVLGTQTFGKGSVQTILPLSNNAAIKLTTARYYTPNGRSIQAKGIVPDIMVEESANGDTRERIREADLDRHLDNDKEKAPAKDAEKPAAKPHGKNGKGKSPGKDEDEEAGKTPPFEFTSKSDYQLGQAMNLLKAWQIIKK